MEISFRLNDSIRQQPRAVDDAQNVYLIRPYPVDDAVGLFDDLPDIFCFILWNFTALEGAIGDLFGTASDFVHRPFFIHRGVEGNVFIDVEQVIDGVLCPVHLHSGKPNLLRTSLTSTVLPSSLSLIPASMACRT